ncbi:MAG TPA: glycosyltransferase family 1 protein [Pyrinomonadaceae bacterium]
MRIVLDGMPLAEVKTGVGTYTFELASALAVAAPADEFELVSPRPFLAEVLGHARLDNLALVYTKPNTIRRRWWTIGLPAYLRRAPPALFHGTNFEVPLGRNYPTVLTIHDLSWLLHSNTHAARAVVRGRLRLPLMARKATLVITPSQRIRSEVCAHLKIDPNRVFAVPLAPRDTFVPLQKTATVETRRRLRVEDQFLLFVGTIEPRKNLFTLLRAFEELIRNTELRPQLVIAGQQGWKPRKLLSHLQKSPVRDRVHLIGYVSDADLCALYSSCRAFIYPSLYEGFGLPPLEAMACGAAVIATAVPSVTESSYGDPGSKAAVVRLISPLDVNDLARSIAEVLSDDQTRQRFSTAGMKHAAHFSWAKTAGLTREVYSKALVEFQKG